MDHDELLSADPDSLGEYAISLAFNPVYPLALGQIECAAGLDVTLKVKILTTTPALHVIELLFTGKCLDLNELQMRLTDWPTKMGVSRMTLEEFRARDRVMPSTNTPDGISELGVDPLQDRNGDREHPSDPPQA